MKTEKIEQLTDNKELKDPDRNGDKWKLTSMMTDNRPLTDETLEELGFVKHKQGRYTGCYVYQISHEMNLVETQSGTVELTTSNSPVWNTVGSVKMLIEASKGG